jgi:tungstate transport system permease protein
VGLFWDAIKQSLHLIFSGNSYVFQVMLMSLRVSGVATLAGLIVGIPIGTWLGMKRFRGWSVVAAIVNTGLLLPPVVVGLYVYMLLSREGPLGSLGWLYSVSAMTLAEFIIIAPVIAAITMAAVGSVPKDVRLQALGLGASRRQTTWLVVREARVSLMAAVVAGFGAGISEVGAVQMVGGNLSVAGHNQTGTMTTAIMQLVRQGQFATAMALGIILIVLSFIITMILTRTQQGLRRRWLQS